MSYTDYLSGTVDRFWQYADPAFLDKLKPPSSAGRQHSPVFLAEHADLNLIYPPDLDDRAEQVMIECVSKTARHRAFANMRSSQALAQTVFGNLVALNKLGALEGLEAEDGSLAFFDGVGESAVTLELDVDYLGEPRPTSIDVMVVGSKRVAVECKFTEQEFGRCSRPGLSKDSHSHCDGTYTHQQSRLSRCSLSEQDIRYWDYVPKLFDWAADKDLVPCPLRDTYQITRNVLAACVRPDGVLDQTNGHALVIYDERNPMFLSGGTADNQWRAATSAITDDRLLRRCSWQCLLRHLSGDDDLQWLVSGLDAKYGLRPTDISPTSMSGA